jgi:hypothetical protein
MCVVSWLGWESLRLDAAGTDVSAPIIAAIACSLLVVSVLRRESAVRVSDLVGREVLAAFGIALCGTLAMSIPAMAEPHLTTISEGNNDVALYALVERS